MRCLMVAVCFTLLLAISSSAQESDDTVADSTLAVNRENEHGGVEIGTMLGIQVLFAEGETATVVAAPGTGSFAGAAALYFTLLSSAWMFEPQIHLQLFSSDGNTSSLASGFLQVGYLITPEAKGSPYVAAHVGAFFVDSGSNDNTIGGIGVAAGYRWVATTGGAARFEVRYRRWEDDSSNLNELTFALGVGGIFH